MFLAEALYLQGKFPQSLEQSRIDYVRFSRVLGPENQLTLAALTMKAMNEGSMEEYDDAIRDSLAVYTAQPPSSAGKFIKENSLTAAASFECHAGRIDAALDHARQVIRECSQAANSQPFMVHVSNFTIAECLISQAESADQNRKTKLALEADKILQRINVPLVSDYAGNKDFEGAFDVAQARVALLRDNIEAAKKYALKAEPFLNKAGSDPYEKKVLENIKMSARQ